MVEISSQWKNERKHLKIFQNKTIPVHGILSLANSIKFYVTWHASKQCHELTSLSLRETSQCIYMHTYIIYCRRLIKFTYRSIYEKKRGKVHTTLSLYIFRSRLVIH